MEEELEILLGELQIKMKGITHQFMVISIICLLCLHSFTLYNLFFFLAGLIGFARLCPGDQYEVNLKFAQTSSSQCWSLQVVQDPHHTSVLSTGGIYSAFQNYWHPLYKTEHKLIYKKSYHALSDILSSDIQGHLFPMQKKVAVFYI